MIGTTFAGRPGSTPTPPRYLAWERVDVCSICASKSRSAIDEEASVVRCRDCGHRYVDPRPTQGEITRGYSISTAYDAWIEAAGPRYSMWQRRYDLVLADLPPGRLLDVGAGIGTFLSIAQVRGWSVDGTEVSSTAIARGKELHDVVIRLGMLEDVAPSGPYDAISLWHVIEHLPDPGATLRLCREILSETGVIILAMPNDGGAAWALTRLANVVRRILGRPASPRYLVLRPGVESHLQHFDQQSIRRLLEQCGFIIDRISVDDANPVRSQFGVVAFGARRLLSRVTPWNFGREMLVTGRRAPRVG